MPRRFSKRGLAGHDGACTRWKTLQRRHLRYGEASVNRAVARAIADRTADNQHVTFAAKERTSVDALRRLAVDADERQAGLAIQRTHEVTRRFGQDDFERGPHVRLEQMPTAQGAVGSTDHDVSV